MKIIQSEYHELLLGPDFEIIKQIEERRRGEERNMDKGTGK